MNNRPEVKNKRKLNTGAFVISAVTILLAAVNILLYNTAAERGIKAFRKSYDLALKETSDETYEDFYKAAFDQYRTRSELTVNIPGIQEDGKLSVLSISDKVFIQTENASDEPGTSSWLEIPVEGRFTLDIRSCEFITDQQRSMIKLRMPHPEFSDFSIDYENTKLITFSRENPEGLSVNGEEAARRQLQDNDLRIQESISSSQKFSENALSAAEKKVKQLLHSVNTDENIKVETEFFE